MEGSGPVGLAAGFCKVYAAARSSCSTHHHSAWLKHHPAAFPGRGAGPTTRDVPEATDSRRGPQQRSHHPAVDVNTSTGQYRVEKVAGRYESVWLADVKASATEVRQIETAQPSSTGGLLVADHVARPVVERPCAPGIRCGPRHHRIALGRHITRRDLLP